MTLTKNSKISIGNCKMIHSHKRLTKIHCVNALNVSEVESTNKRLIWQEKI